MPVKVRKIGEKIDFAFNKMLPKKFIVFAVATVMAFMGKIDGFQWFIIAGAYLGVNVIQHYAKKQFNGGKE